MSCNMCRNGRTALGNLCPNGCDIALFQIPFDDTEEDSAEQTFAKLSATQASEALLERLIEHHPKRWADPEMDEVKLKAK